MRIKIVGDSTPPFVIDELRKHLRIDYDVDSDGHPDDDMIMDVYLPAAIESCEAFLGQSISLKTIRRSMDVFPDNAGAIELIDPVISVTSITYLSVEGINEVISSDAYILDNFSEPNFIVLKDGYDWPEVDEEPNAITIEFVSGYSLTDEASESMPPMIKVAVLMQLGHLYENRENTSDKPSKEIAVGVESLLRPLRSRMGFA
jgi:uncharacterized phiE125 gp8 family phage protein